MMTREQYLFGKLAEEAAELAKEAIKCQQFGPHHVFGNAKGVTNIQRLSAEFNDTLGVVDMINREYGVMWITMNDQAISAKGTKVNKWYDVARDMGLVE